MNLNNDLGPSDIHLSVPSFSPFPKSQYPSSSLFPLSNSIPPSPPPSIFHNIHLLRHLRPQSLAPAPLAIVIHKEVHIRLLQDGAALLADEA
jgi:hypothetical protein